MEIKLCKLTAGSNRKRLRYFWSVWVTFNQQTSHLKQRSRVHLKSSQLLKAIGEFERIVKTTLGKENVNSLTCHLNTGKGCRIRMFDRENLSKIKTECRRVKRRETDLMRKADAFSANFRENERERVFALVLKFARRHYLKRLLSNLFRGWALFVNTTRDKQVELAYFFRERSLCVRVFEGFRPQLDKVVQLRVLVYWKRYCDFLLAQSENLSSFTCGVRKIFNGWRMFCQSREQMADLWSRKRICMCLFKFWRNDLKKLNQTEAKLALIETHFRNCL